MTVPLVVDALRDHMVTAGIVRRPDTPGAGPRPWLPVVWRHPDNGAIAPGDMLDENAGENAQDDGLVLSLMYAPGIPPAPGTEERRIDGVDVVLRGRAMRPIVILEEAIRRVLLGDPPDPGGRTDWIMGGDPLADPIVPGLYVIQSRQWRPFAPLAARAGVFTFSVGYTIESRAV